MAIYLQPVSVDDAIAALLADDSSSRIDRLTILAGATDFYPASTTRQAWGEPTPRNILDISGIKELHGIIELNGYVRIGAMVTWSELMRHPLPAAFYGLKQASRHVGGVQIQNRGTLVGNICNASPAADGMPPLLALDAEVEIASHQGRRKMPLKAFVLGNRKTVLQQGEMVTALLVPPPAENEKSAFLKLGSRIYLVISIASVAANIALDAEGKISTARIAVGACSAVPQRLASLENKLIGMRLEHADKFITKDMLAALDPIDDLRASASYRRDAAQKLIVRALAEFSDGSRQAA